MLHNENFVDLSPRGRHFQAHHIKLQHPALQERLCPTDRTGIDFPFNHTGVMDGTAQNIRLTVTVIILPLDRRNATRSTNG